MLRAVVAFAAILLVPGRAGAEVFVASDGVLHFSLSRGRVGTALDSELKISARGVWSHSGVKRASRAGRFEWREVTVLNEPYDLRDRRGGRWRLWIRSVGPAAVTAELIRVRPRTFPLQSFRVASVTVLGTATQPNLPALTLFPDGTYRLGTNQGRYRREEPGVRLGGAAAHWGRGGYAVLGEGLVFRFKRGGAIYEVRYEQVDRLDPPESDEFIVGR